MYRAQVIGVPPQFLDELESVAFATGIFKSWLAAVCEMTGWDPSYLVTNLSNGTRRRVGIAGVWAEVAEITIRGIDGYIGPAGWAVESLGANACVGGWRGSGLRTDVVGNMTEAANILLDCARILEQVCGEVNSLAFLRWQWGCHWVPIDIVTGNSMCDRFPPGIPNIFVQETERIIAAQKVYAEIFNEPIFGAPPLVVALSANRTIIGPGGSVTFQAQASGGNPPYQYHFVFGDGTFEDPLNPVASHIYPDVGTFLATVTVQDRVGLVEQSPALLITVEEGGPVEPPPGGGGGTAVALGLLGILGVAGLIGLAAKKKKV